MEDIVNQTNTDYRSQVYDRLRQNYPDAKYGDQDGDGVNDDVFQHVSELLSQLDAKIKTYDENTARLTNALGKNANALAFFNTLVETDNAGLAFGKIYGRNAFEALSTPEGQKIIAELEADDQAKAEKEAAFKQEFESNFSKSLDALKAWSGRRGLSDDEAYQIFTEILDVLDDAELGKYDEGLFELAWKGRRYDEDVASARHEGEIDGRNAKIHQGNLRRMQAPSEPVMNGRSTRVAESPVEKGDDWRNYL